MADHQDDRERQGQAAEGVAARPDAIAAIATPPGRGGVAIVRVSGRGLADWAAPLVGRDFAPRRARRASFLDARGAPIDDGLVLFFPAPASYTGEDVLELHGHGGPVVAQLVLARTLELGARLAEPGEFTRRAYLNDKLDLAQAEAVADLIEAASASAARSALRSLRGEFSARVNELVQALVTLRMLIEATLDFPEEEIDAVHLEDARTRLADIRARLDRALAQARQGSVLRSGLQVALIGRPNVGKSSLLNRLACDEVAIVTPIAGTTRDTVRERIELDGVPIEIHDTAGLRETTDAVERIGIERTWRAVERADAVLLVVDAAGGATDADRAIDARVPAAVPRVIVHNKIDLLGTAPHVERIGDRREIHLSARSGAGIDLLEAELLAIAGWQPGNEDVFLARERHVEALRRAAARLAEATTQFDRLEFLAEELRLAQSELSTITGEFTADDLLGEIFSRFCIGK